MRWRRREPAVRLQLTYTKDGQYTSVVEHLTRWDTLTLEPSDHPYFIRWDGGAPRETNSDSQVEVEG